MIIDALELRRAIDETTKGQPALEKVALLERDWEMITQIKNLLQPFAYYI